MRWIMREIQTRILNLAPSCFMRKPRTIASLPRQRCWQLRPPSEKMWYASSKPGSGI